VRQTTKIEAVTLDTVVQEPVKLLKVDVEGADWNALRGAERLLAGGRPPHLILEVNDTAAHGLGYKALDMVDWTLRRHGQYQMYLLERRRIRPMSRDELAREIQGGKRLFYNVWFKAS
jgi:hypothetical protein